MKAFAVWLLGVVLVPVVALAQAPAADVNTITSVQVNGGTVSITGTKKPNFTTFTMTDPPRLVIDISEAVFSGVPEEVQVGNGTVTGIRTASYGSDASAIARVLIGYEREVETDIQANGNQLVVKVAGGGSPAVAQAEPAAQPAPATEGTAAQASAAADADRQAQEKAAAQAAAAAEADRQAQEKATAEAAARAQADAEAEKKRQEEARAEAQKQEQARTQQAQAQAAEDQKRQEAEARASAQAAADEKKRQEEEARASAARAEEERRAAAQAAADEKKRQEADARASAKNSAEERRAAAEAAQEERRAAAEAAAEERRAAAQAAAEERRQRAADAQASRASKPREVAQATPARERMQVSDSSGPVEVSSRRKTMTLVGFQQQSGASRVFIRTNEPVRYTVNEEGGAVVLELENTRIDLSNNTRPLDTSYFSSPVTRVEADASGRAVRVTIQLRQQAPYQARQDGNVIALDFQRAAR